MKTIPPARNKPRRPWADVAKQLEYGQPNVSARLSVAPTQQSTTYVSNLAVAHDKRGQGIGTDYMRKLTSAADEHGETLELGARDDLVPWYEGFGFKHEGESPLGGNRLRRTPRPKQE